VGNTDSSRMKASLRRWNVDVVKRWGPELAEAMRVEAPLGKVTPTSRPPGTLRKSIKAGRTSQTGTSATVQVLAPVIQARTTDKGARAHRIPRSGSARLRFFWANGPQGAGIYHFRHVNHPGNAPQNWWQPGLKRRASTTLRRAARRTSFR